MNYEKLISDVNLAFAGNQFEVSLKKAQEAINKDDSKAEGYVCAGKAALSLGSAEMAEHYFKTATEKDKNNGNIFFLLGYAQAMSGHSSKTVQSLTRALESNCDTSVKGQIYKMISMINTEQGDYGNALTNLSQAEDYIGLDYEIPIANGVLTTENDEQCQERIEMKARDCARCAVEMANLAKEFVSADDFEENPED